jgi:hypothetical protein
VDWQHQAVTKNHTKDFFGRLNGEVRLAATDWGGGGFLVRIAC